MPNVPLPPPTNYGLYRQFPPDIVLQNLPFGSTVSNTLLVWLQSLPVSTLESQAYLKARWQTLSWTGLHIFMSDLVSEVEVNIGMPWHSSRVSYIALQCGVALGLQPVALSQLYWGGALHDIGKMAMNQAILSKPQALTSYEWQLVRQHPVWGHAALTQVLNNSAVAEIALTHHEHWDGCGYPQGLSGKAIPLHGRIVAVADTFDALTTPRAYKKPVREDMALKIIESEAGRQFDPDLVQKFLDGGVLQQRDLGADRPDFG